MEGGDGISGFEKKENCIPAKIYTIVMYYTNFLTKEW